MSAALTYAALSGSGESGAERSTATEGNATDSNGAELNNIESSPASDAVASNPTEAGPGPEVELLLPAPRSLLPLALGAVVVLALAMVGVYFLRFHNDSTPPVMETYQETPLPTATDPAPAASEAAAASDASAASSAPATAQRATTPAQPGAATSAKPAATASQPLARSVAASGFVPASNTSAPQTAAPSAAPTSEIHEEIPEVPPHVLESIHGHVRVSVRLIVDREGAVFAALVDEPGPSRYFEKLAIEAAKKWTFPPLETSTSRLELIRFDFTRQGATGRAVEVE